MTAKHKIISLYIKRAESHHTKEYITNVFFTSQYGKVSDVRFIKKSNNFGEEYFGAVVTFERWFMNGKVKNLFEQLNSSVDGSIKIFHDYSTRRYWFINEFKPEFPEFEELTTIGSDLPDKERIKELEKLVKSMSAQLLFLQTKQEKNERMLMEFEQQKTQDWLHNLEMKSQLVELESSSIINEKKLKQQIEKLEGENTELIDQVQQLHSHLQEKEFECDELLSELSDEKNIVTYLESQAEEMRDMLKITNYYHRHEYMVNDNKMIMEEIV